MPSFLSPLFRRVPRRPRRLVLLALLMAALALVLAACETDVDAARNLTTDVNGARAGAHLAALQWDPQLAAKATAQAQHMAAVGYLVHSNLAAGVTEPWSRLGENIGSGPDSGTVNAGMMASPVHRGNILDAGFQCIGIGVAHRGATLYVVEDFRAP